MGPVRLGLGTEWLLDGRAYRIVRQPAPDRYIALDARFNVEQEFTQSELLKQYAEGRLTFSTGTSSANTSPVTSPSLPQVIHDLDAQQQQVLQKRWQAIRPLTELPHRPTQEDYRRRADELSAAGIRLSSRSLRRYLRTWKLAGRDRRSLLPRTYRSGGPGRPRRHSWMERFPNAKALVEDAIRDVYLTKARRPMSIVVDRVFEDLQRLNSRLSTAQAIPLPRRDALYRAISRKIKQLDPWEVDRARWGRYIADRRHAPTRPRRLATRILERVEIDHTKLKVVVGTEAGPIGQPWLTALIDYHSRLIVGFCLGFEPPSYAVVMEALRRSILPKQYVSVRYSRIQGVWPCFGVPERLVCDRGADLTSKDLENAAFQLGIVLDFNPPRTPHFKGSIEAFFGGINDRLIAALPGRTFRSWERRADYQPDDGPLMTYESLLEVIHIYIIDAYSRGKHPASQMSRLEMWQESAAEHPPCLPAASDDLVVLLARTARRNLTARGVELHGMFYTSDELMALRAELASHHRDGRGIQVRYNPWDLGSVWVLNPLNKRYLLADAVDAAIHGMNEYQWRVLRRAVRNKFDQPDHLMSLAASRNALRDVVEGALQKPSRRRRSRAQRYLDPLDSTQHSQVRQNADHEVASTEDENTSGTEMATGYDSLSVDPMSSPVTPTSSQNTEPIEVDPSAIDVDDWDIASPGT